MSPNERIAALEAQIESMVELVNNRYLFLEKLIATNEAHAREISDSARIAIEKADAAQQRVNQTQNEWRGAINDTQRDFPARTEFNALRELVNTCVSKSEHNALAMRLSAVELQQSAGGGRAGGLSSAQALLFQILPLVVAALALALAFFKH
jgi:hypothetical protein